MTPLERQEVIGYFARMRDDAREFMRLFVKDERSETYQFWKRRIEMCDRAVQLIVLEQK
jgi:hypothetical protein